MSFETAADSFIRPRIAAQAVPASAVVEQAVSDTAAVQSALRGPGGNEIGRQGGVDTADGEFSFDDLIDLVNPLHHIPIVGTLYRKITGDEIKAPAQVLGGLLYGGPLGFVASAANAVVEEATGGDLGDAVYAMVFGPDEAGEQDLVAEDAGPQTPASAIPAAAAEPAPFGPAPIDPAPIDPAQVDPAPIDPAQVDPAQVDPARAVALAAPVAGPAEPPQALSVADSPDAAATLPPVPAGALTGKAALDAFLNDLAGVGRAAQADAQLTPPPALPAATPATALQAAPAVAPTAAHAANRAEQPASNAATRGSRAAPGRETAAVPPNLFDLGLRDRRGSAAPPPAVSPVPIAQPGPAPERAAPNLDTAESGITIRPGRVAAGVDPRFLTSDRPATGPLIETGAEDSDFSDQMMQALQKYEDMLNARRVGARS